MTTDDAAPVSESEKPGLREHARDEKPAPSGLDRGRVFRITTVMVATMLLASVVFYLLVSLRH